MPLHAGTLANALKASLEADGFIFPVGGMNTKFIDALCVAVIAHIQANAVVSGPVVVTSVSGVTPGGGSSGPGAGTLSGGTIT